MGTASGNPNWENLPSQASPISAQALNNIENALDATQATANAAQADLTTRLSNAALQGLFPVYRMWDGAAYPPRIAGALNIFFGPTDPGLAMEEEDYWANPNVTTMDTIVAAVQDTSSLLYAAIQNTTVGTYVNIPLAPVAGSTAPFMKVGTTELYGFECSSTATTRLAGTVKRPFGWGSVRVRIFYTHLVGAGDVRLSRTASAYRDGATPRNISEVVNTATAPAVGIVGSYLLTGGIDVTMMENLSVSIARNATSPADTLEENIYILGARIEKIA